MGFEVNHLDYSLETWISSLENANMLSLSSGLDDAISTVSVARVVLLILCLLFTISCLFFIK
ncbi:MAG: hypothetical protein RR598_03630, partial [Anaerorhabdus sp.]